ncbi:MAG: mechanosensitive ion channel family protein [Pseudomonadota bacterium]
MNSLFQSARCLAFLLLLTMSFNPVLSVAQEGAAADGPVLSEELLNPNADPETFELRLIPLTNEELAATAAEWLTIVRAKTEEVIEAQIRVGAAEGAAAEQARTALAEITTERKALFDKYSAVIDAWEKKGGDEAAIAELRAYRSAIIVEETRTADAETLMTQAFAWATDEDGGIQLLIDTVVIIGSLLGLYLFARIVRGFVRRWIGRVPNLSKLLQSFLVMVAYWLTFALGLMVVLSGLGIDISPVFALIGGASFILAFAFQSTLGNLASGLMIMINRPFDEGDYVDVAGTAGTVKSVSIMSTTLITPDNQVIVVPNANVWGNTITNVTTSPTRRVDLVFGIGYDDSIATAQQVLEETVAAHPLVLAEPAPVIRVSELADSSVNFICRPWVQGADYWTVYWDLMRQVKENFDSAGVSIPYPQQDVHMHQASSKPEVDRPSPPSAVRSGGEGDADDEMKGAEGAG